MADISLKPISELPAYSLDAGSGTDFSNVWLVVSIPDTFNAGSLVSRKSSVQSLMNVTNNTSIESIQQRIDNSLIEFGKSLSGTVQTALSNSLPASRVVITDTNSKLTASNIALAELNCLQGCVANIKASFDLIQLSATVISASLNNQMTTLIGTTLPTINGKISDLSSSVIPTVSSTLSSALVAKSNILSTKLDTLSIDVDIIKGKYVDKDGNAAMLDELSTSILQTVATVSAQLSNALVEFKEAQETCINRLSTDVLTNANNIQFILNNLNIGVDMYETTYKNGDWTYNQIKDKNGNDSVGYLFKLDATKESDRNEDVLLIGLGTPLIQNNELSVAPISAVDGCGIENVSAALSNVATIDVDVETTTEDITVKIDENQQNIKFEQLIFLNIN